MPNGLDPSGRASVRNMPLNPPRKRCGPKPEPRCSVKAAAISLEKGGVPLQPFDDVPMGFGTIDKRKQKKQHFPFHFYAQFENDEDQGFECRCCRIRLMVSWNKTYHDFFPLPGPHGSFPEGSKPDEFYEDRDFTGKGTYGKRTMFPTSRDDVYADQDGNFNGLNGCFYDGYDAPDVNLPFEVRGAVWTFRVDVQDICAPNKPVVATSAPVEIRFHPK